MKIGMNLLLWTDQAKPEIHASLLRQIKAWGFDGVELAADTMDRSDALAFRELLDGLHLGRTTIAALDANLADPASPELSLRRSAVDMLKKALDNTHILGAELLCGPLFQGLGRFTGRGPQTEEWQYAVEILREVGEYAQSLGICIALEPLNRFEMYMVNTLEAGVRFVKDVNLPNVGLLADTHHSNIEEGNVLEAWRQAAPYINHVHISENHRGVPGTGHAILPEIFDLLVELNYNQWLTIEAFSQSVPGLIPRLHLWRSYATSTDAAASDGICYIHEQLKRAVERRSDKHANR
ncbi:sugar phosphate isomerase/epimerase family protein [Paenibacillus qinlingensis]|uniref:sugar phosphate isomerase/epimerase family protein n=1 Tax=Paenibacillus qinlingensis TaxID=1837343 RepID=UPI001566AA97|nr:sugar phosphate isomerase/epimerase family protein [Paenibacillus qinlingensis]NQX60739.1 sugar phosphate isomerase/epimerase [Paenibacillus qinlingensis]